MPDGLSRIGTLNGNVTVSSDKHRFYTWATQRLAFFKHRGVSLACAIIAQLRETGEGGRGTYGRTDAILHAFEV